MEVTEPMRLQLALQVAALESMGHVVAGQEVYFTEHRRRVPAALDAEDFGAARCVVEQARSAPAAATAPQPLEDDSRCYRCSHASVCLPDERPLARVHRRIVVADPDNQVLHLATPGARAALRSGRIEVRKGDEVTTVPLERVQAVSVHGNVDLSGALIRELLWREIPVLWTTSTGRLVGWASSAGSPNGNARARQHAGGGDALEFARQFIAAKISNQATLLRRNGEAAQECATLRRLARDVVEARTPVEVFGIEGRAADLYFGRFTTMLHGSATFAGRDRRPARDPMNAALNYVYALLLADSVRAVRACGLDPHTGFLHSSNRNKPALALDLMEEFRAPVADSVVVRAFNNGELREKDFRRNLDACVLTERGRKNLIAGYERRVTSELKHPTFGYSVTWRRAMEIQARLILGVLDGTQPRYIGVRTR